ncbi:protein IQ-DOMAIN 3-like [Impatiens glandulifera]|uniref:protein IQ-DOMAIN 3-like n=1 Tax=Impatiens glandulifera TaxID=253017 RepID=UPI001FB16C08|nr:protein IQ-DOMAIN 3-like [Impatiens glandulifera]
MGKKGNWFLSIKKALIPESKEQKSKKKKKWFGKEKLTVPNHLDEALPPPPLILSEEVKVVEAEEDEQTKHAYSVVIATAAAAEAAVAAAHAAAEVVRLTSAAVVQFPGKSKEEVAVIRIQTAFRGYMAKRALRALRGLVRLKAFLEGTNAKRQTTKALKSMQNVGRVQAQIQARRITILEENQALQKQLLQKQTKEEILQMGDDWDDSNQSKEQLETGLMNKYKATMRRERALAYSYSHQQIWKKSAKSTILTFMNPNNPQWGWSWLERWSSVSEEMTTLSTPQSSSKIRKLKSTNPRGKGLNLIVIENDDTRSVFSVQSERNRRRHSISGSSIRDDESLASSPSFPSYMASTQSAKAKSRLQSPLGLENNVMLTEKAATAKAVASVKKRLSFPASSPVKPRRLSGPPRIETRFDKENSDINGVTVA